MSRKTALIMAGGTGGHIFPGLAVAQELRSRGWTVHWLGAPDSMEERLVPPQGFALERVAFSGVRGKGLRSLVGMPWRLLKALQQARAVLRKVRPDVVVGMGGYITVPGGLAAKLAGVPIVLHEQNSVPGMANKLLARMARRVFSAFPNAIAGGQWVGNPLRAEFLQQPEPAQRFAGRSGPLQLLVVGGSLGAKALNEVVPQALARMAPGVRPVVTHQSGAKQIDALQANYAAAGVQASLTPFIDDAAKAYADADVIVCRAGASTVTELAAVGAAAVFVPFPAAVDDHQTANARFLVDAGAGWLVQQSVLTPENLAQMLENMQRSALLDRAQKAKKMQKLEAAQVVADACEELAR
ncbi:UDP-N-acetylglucosamine--N-acetylmuramyl-(pentapeptide) pyrophosphoryl-undecaprenol N-acetylglucosamine transferase [Comamonas sp. BIGb0152]|uniref:undecaprenyldiphospho-muramoylpentapeptide beta-N-acetylglucosaminyltransferase n=1 Tax=Comamonas sp. BIGb0152 TaxID=2940601 RepID=UPI0021671C05|nr:undecaprenyldiphospho-muramoylpentapeptide beta-N-acetylglucosaminyltransferase [Comamonas sp. BIGb0152]MCS4292409.1 UDP-N-acetylglucosamine--N-acetylmuramyl-(pentapeptide) pyrophosphoryl-undecaprenol N-acetylglucosamine transferase [Comamonas sp. BIGb0152]